MEHSSYGERRAAGTACVKAGGLCCATGGASATQAATGGVSGDGASPTLASQSVVRDSACAEGAAECGAAAGAQEHALHRAGEQEASVSRGVETLGSQAARQDAAASSASGGQRDVAAHQEVHRGTEQAGGASCSETAGASTLPVHGLSASSTGDGPERVGTAASANQQQVRAPRRFVGRRAAAAAAAARGGDAAKALAATPGSAKAQRFVRQQVPDEVLHDSALNAAIAVLPANYNFEVHKTVWRIRQAGAKRVVLQFPEGLLMFACVIADILERHAGAEHCMVLGDVTYGACCVDDLSAGALGAQLLVHYGHSCLVPVGETTVPCMYVFVDIKVDVPHLVETVRLNFEAGSRLAMAGTIQFAASLQLAREQLAVAYPALAVPQAKPLSPGEVLGCTAPVVAGGADAIVFVADGRFHLEAIMIANPDIPAFRYDPYARVLTREVYDQAGMRAARRAAVEAARGARFWGLVLGTLGRQGNPRVLRHLQDALAKRGLEHVVVLLSEVAPARLARLAGPQAWVQVACPRLSIDWGEGFALPTLTPFEALVALGEVPPWWEVDVPAGSHAPYPMDYYARDGGVWSSSHHRPPARSAAGG